MSVEIANESGGLGKLLKERIYQRSAPAPALQDDLAETASLDLFAEGKQSQWLIFSIVIIALFVFTLFCGGKGYLEFIVAVASGFCLCKWLQWRSINLPDERYLLAGELIELFIRDMSPDAPLSLRLGFEKINQKNNKVIIKRGDRNRFMSCWLILSGQFADGSKFSVRLAELLDIKFRKGKRKPKGYVVSLTLAFSKKGYGTLQLNTQSVAKMVQLQETATLKSVKAKGNVLHLSAKLPPLAGAKPEDITNELCLLVKFLLLSSYEILSSVRKPLDFSAS